MSAERRLAMIANFFDEVWSWGNLAVVDERIAADFINHDPSNPWVGTGPEGVKEYVRTYRTAFPDLHFTLHDIVVEGDRIAVRWTARGTHDGELRGIAATGKRVAVTGITVFRLAGDKLAEAWIIYDMLGLLQQLGVLPSP
ncbi:MAG TPA: ester cyclase [Ardenticatenaceae bacterium]|nr:ester cyclase [Ardenticatenaceae bacterium]